MGRACLSLSCGYLWGAGSFKTRFVTLAGRAVALASCLRVYRLDFCNLISANAVKNSSMAARETYDGPTPELPYDLRAALSLGDTETIRRALAAGVSPNVEVRSTSLRNETYYWPLLLLACGGGVIGSDRPELISMLLEAGANPDGPPDKKITPIHMAVNHSRIRTVELLIAAGASLHVRSSNDKTPVEILSHFNCRRMLPMLLRAGSPLPRFEFPLLPGGPPRDLQRWLDITYHRTPYNVRSRQILCGLVEKVAAAGSWAAYERAHRMQLARIFAPKLPRIPKYVVPTVVAYWAHTGWY